MRSGQGLVFTAAFCVGFAAWSEDPISTSDAGMPSDVSYNADGGSAEAVAKSRRDKSFSDPCAKEVKRIEDRKVWLADRQAEQRRIGISNPAAGVPNAAGLYCDQHPNDAQCKISIPTTFEPDEVTWKPGQSPLDRDPSIIGLNRELDSCRRKNGTGR